MAMKTLDEKFLHDLGDVYDAEHRFLKAQETMAKQATSEQLKTMIEHHHTETEQQIANLEQVFSLLGEKPKRVNCPVAVALVEEGEKAMKETKGEPALLDCAIAASAAKVEHYEMAGYRGLIMSAQQIGKAEIVDLLRRNLDQEERTAQKVEKSLPLLLQQAGGEKERTR